MGSLESMIAAVSEAIKKGVGRKNLVAIVAIVVLAGMADAPLNLCLLVAAIAASAIITQWSLDMYEVRKTGKDQKDNGGTHDQTTDGGETDLVVPEVPTPQG